jgi:FdhD protein
MAEAVRSIALDGRTDNVVVEEPLEIRIAGDTVAITMRTPGFDRELVLGFLWAEGIISSTGDVSAIAHCGRPDEEGFGNTVEVTLAPGVRFDPETGPTRRGTIATSACGVCGRRTIDDMLARFTPLAPHASLTQSVVSDAVKQLRDHQPIFAKTGGCHAASLVRFSGAHVATFEDVGRHNAVDKVVGSRLLAGEVPLASHVLVVSGRTSFEIVQKAMAAGIPVVAGVSAPSSLAIDLARKANITLAGFVRGASMTVYSGVLAV